MIEIHHWRLGGPGFGCDSYRSIPPYTVSRILPAWCFIHVHSRQIQKLLAVALKISLWLFESASMDLIVFKRCSLCLCALSSQSTFIAALKSQHIHSRDRGNRWCLPVDVHFDSISAAVPIQQQQQHQTVVSPQIASSISPCPGTLRSPLTRTASRARFHWLAHKNFASTRLNPPPPPISINVSCHIIS